MQWKLGPVMQPWSRQSNTGSTQSFDAQPLPPSPVVVPELEPKPKPPSGRVIVNPLLLALPPLLLPPLLLPPVEEVVASSPAEASSEGGLPASSPGGSQGLHPPLLVEPDPLPEPLLEPPPEPELLVPWPAPESVENPWRASVTLAVQPTAAAPNNPTRTRTCCESIPMAYNGILTEQRSGR
jgi:hypothetical protein